MDLGGVLFTLETGFADNKMFVICMCDVLDIYLQREAKENHQTIILE